MAMSQVLWSTVTAFGKHIGCICAPGWVRGQLQNNGVEWCLLEGFSIVAGAQGMAIGPRMGTTWQAQDGAAQWVTISCVTASRSSASAAAVK